LVQKNQQLFKKSTLQKSSIIAQAAAKKSQLRESVDISGLPRGVLAPVDIDDIPQIEVLDVFQQPLKRVPKTEKQSLAKSP
jgi:hypothetical protein